MRRNRFYILDDSNPKMGSCLAHPKRRAEDWHGHVHLRNRSFHSVQAGWCEECAVFSQHTMYVKRWKRCQNCCGSVAKFR